MTRRVPPWIWGLAIILAPSLVFIVIHLARPKAEAALPVDPSDRAYVVTMADLAQPFDPRREVLALTRDNDVTTRLTYRYPAELMPGDAVSLECLVVRGLDELAAKRALDLVEWEVRKSLDPDPALFSWGDDSRAGAVLHDGRPVGTFFATRKGRAAFVFRVTGLQLEPERLRALLSPRLEQLTRFGEPESGGAR